MTVLAAHRRGIVAGGAPATVRAGAAVLAAGGNAMDAAIAACFAATSAEAMLASLGAAGVMVVRRADGRVEVLDFFADAPRGFDPARRGNIARAVFGDATVEVELGPATVAVPGLVPGLCDASTRYGRLPLRDALAPAISLAREGVPVDAFFAQSLEMLRAVVSWSDGARAMFSANGDLAREGDTLRFHNNARVLEELALDWRDAYRELGRKIVQTCGASSGGSLTEEDFTSYSPVVQEPFEVHHAGARIMTIGAPGRGHRFLVRALESQDRTGRKVVSAGLTTHVSTIDADGMAVAVTVSHGTGAGIVAGGTEIMLNNMLGETHVRSEAVPGRRLHTMMLPTLAEIGGALVALGTGGSERIPAFIAAVLARLVDGDSPDEAVLAPRSYDDGTTLFVEGAGFAESTDRSVVRFAQRHPFFGGVHVAFRHASGELLGFGDPRRGGAVAAG